MDQQTRQTLVTKYKDGYRAVADALAGATDDELDARPAPGKWSAREIVHHLADSEMTSAIRMRNLIAISTPLSKRITAEIGYLNQHGFVRGGPDTSDHVASISLSLSL